MGGRQSAQTLDASATRGSLNSSADTGSRRPQHEFLVDKEADIIRHNWSVLRSGDTQSVGIRIFLRIFELAPGTKLAFETLKDKNKEELLASVLFRSHSMRFMQAVEVTISNLDALDVIIVPNLKQLGRKHTQFHGFHPEYLDAFEQAMDEIWKEELKGEYDDKAHTAWMKIFHLITSNVLEGYTEAQTPVFSHKTVENSSTG